MQPTFLTQLQNPAVKTVLLVGCGGGFDFLHGLVLYPTLKRLGKRVIIGSYSFGDIHAIGAPAPLVFEEGDAVVKEVSAASAHSAHYAPEIHLCSWLDAQHPDQAPHSVYAYYARDFTVGVLRSFYEELCARHAVDAVVLVDGGSDSLMVGDEEGLGDPIEDAVSVAAVAALDGVGTKLLLSVGFGADRFNDVSDAASLRAVAELTRAGGFRGAMAIEPTSAGFAFYRGCLEHIYARQSFRSALAGFIVSAVEGHHGGEVVPPLLASRVTPGHFYVWPLMAMIWAFDVEALATRSLIVDWIKDGRTPRECLLGLYQGRASLETTRGVEELPLHVDMRARRK